MLNRNVSIDVEVFTSPVVQFARCMIEMIEGDAVVPVAAKVPAPFLKEWVP